MKITIDARPLAHPNTGIGRYTSRLVEEFSKSGHQLILYSPNRLSSKWQQLPNTTTRSKSSQTQSVNALIISQLHFARWAYEDKPDVFWSPRHHLPLALRRAVPSVITIHDVAWKRFPNTMTCKSRIAEQMLMAPSIKKAKRIVCVSNYSRAEVEGYWPVSGSKTSTIYLGGINDIRGNSADNNTTISPHISPYLLFVGTLEPRKNLRNLLIAYASLVKTGRVTEKLIIVGGQGWGGLSLSRLITELSIGEDVILLGEVDDKELARLYEHAVCLLMPSLSEGFGLPVLEAMQYAVPAIISSAGALPEIAGESALQCNPNIPEDIAQKIEQLVNDSELHEKLSVHAELRSQQFSWRECATATLRVLEDAANIDASAPLIL